MVQIIQSNVKFVNIVIEASLHFKLIVRNRFSAFTAFEKMIMILRGVLREYLNVNVNRLPFFRKFLSTKFVVLSAATHGC
jgi:hypothetical protein